jgi:hypothetical protein
MKAMNSHGTLWGIACGLAGGMGKYFLQAQLTFPEKLVQAGLTALVCGLLGAAGKYLFDLVVKRFKPKQ